MIQLLVIADDFTGALDTGVQFVRQGYSTIVTLNLDTDFSELSNNYQVIVIDTESRHLSAEESKSIVSNLVLRAKNFGINLFYKKVDSTLRGNIGAELEAALSISGDPYLLFAPAYPEMGRIIDNGISFVNGIPLNQTVFAQDPLNPIKSSKVTDIIRETSDINIYHSNPLEISKDILNFEKGSIIIVDGKTDEDFKKLAFSILQFKGSFIFSGCAGFAQIMSQFFTENGKLTSSLPFQEDYKLLIVCGSVNQTSINQIANAEMSGIHSIRVKPYQYLDKEYLESEEGFLFLDKISQIIEETSCLIIKTVNTINDVTRTRNYAIMKNIPEEEICMRIADFMGKLTSSIITRNKIKNVAVFGGDTIRGTLKYLESEIIIPRREIYPGIVENTLQIKSNTIRLISKAGGFGDEHLIQDLCNHFCS